MRIETIIRVVCREKGISPEMLQLPTRQRDVCNARQLCHSFARTLTKMTLKAIGKEVGKRNHTTVFHSIKAVKNYRNTEKEYCYKFDKLEIILQKTRSKMAVKQLKLSNSSSNTALLKLYDNLIMSSFAINDIYHE